MFFIYRTCLKNNRFKSLLANVVTSHKLCSFRLLVQSNHQIATARVLFSSAFIFCTFFIFFSSVVVNACLWGIWYSTNSIKRLNLRPSTEDRGSKSVATISAKRSVTTVALLGGQRRTAGRKKCLHRSLTFFCLACWRTTRVFCLQVI